jgi:ATP-dependent 26S proteasome regulatory subunit
LTLSGLLNFIDILSSSCGERITVLDTNHLDKLDLTLIQRGRMDFHIEMPYCRFDSMCLTHLSVSILTGHRVTPFASHVRVALN